MDKNLCKNIIAEVLYRKNGVLPGERKDELDRIAESVAKSVDYAPELKTLYERTLRAAIEMAPDGSGYVQYMDYIRELMALQNKKCPQTPRQQYKPTILNEEATNLGFFLRCRKAWEYDKSLTNVSDLTVQWAARWIEHQDGWLAKSETDWCDKVADADASEYADIAKKESARNKSRNEAIVSIVMIKLDRKQKTSPEAVKKFIDEKHAEYEDYFVKAKGQAPDWTVMALNKPVRCSAIKQLIQ